MKKDLKDLKVAIVHEWVYKMVGSERVVDALCEIFPQADVYLMFGDVEHAKFKENVKFLPKAKIHYSWMNKIPGLKKFYRYTYFLWPFVVESYNLNKYDLVISSSHSTAKGVITPIETVHVSYMHTPMRYAWDQAGIYFNQENFSKLKRVIINFFLLHLRMWDIVSNNRIDYLITISNFVNKRIKKYYKREADAIVYPIVDVEKAKVITEKEDYFVCLNPFEPNKGGRTIVKTAMKLGFNLKLIGSGSLKNELMKLSKGYENIEYLEVPKDEDKLELFGKAKALIFGGIQDFGIVPVEAMACGTPVIALGKGGALDSIIEGKTGVFYHDDTVESLEQGIRDFEELNQKGVFKPGEIRKHAEKFSRSVFKGRIKEEILKALERHEEEFRYH